MRGIFVDIENELADLGLEVEMLSGAIDIVKQRSTDAVPAWDWLVVQGLASGIEKVYTGCERVMSMIAAEIDGAKIDRAEGWHIALLKRMAHPFPDVREPVISSECQRALDQLRSFRHRERNTYGLFLDPDIVLERAVETLGTFELFRAEVAAFAAKMQKRQGGDRTKP